MDIRKIIKEELQRLFEDNSEGIVGADIINHFPFSELGDNRQGGFTRDVPGWGAVQVPSTDTGDASTTMFSKEDVVGGETWTHPKTGIEFPNPGYIENFKKRFGEEPVFKLNPDAPWFGKVEIINPAFKEWRESYRQGKAAVLKSWGTTNESGVTDKIVDKKTMDTPTGTIFTINMNENSKKKSKIVNESKNVHIKNFPYQDDLDHILDISNYVIRKVARDFLPKNMSKEEMEGVFIGESFQPDGGYAFEPTGIMNFYIGRYPSHLIENTVAYIKYILGEQNIKVGKPSKEGDRVIRIPIVSNDAEEKNHPEINLSNSNARDVFEDVLGYESVDEEMDAVDLLMRVKSGRKNILSKPEKSSHVQQGNMIGNSFGQDYYNSVLNRIEKLAQWAIDNGYRTLYVI